MPKMPKQDMLCIWLIFSVLLIYWFIFCYSADSEISFKWTYLQPLNFAYKPFDQAKPILKMLETLKILRKGLDFAMLKMFGL